MLSSASQLFHNMPNTSLQDAIKEAFASCPSSVVIYDTLEIRQPGVQDSVFIVRSHQAITATDEDGNVREFEPVGFQFTLPPTDDQGFQSLNISIDNRPARERLRRDCQVGASPGGSCLSSFLERRLVTTANDTATDSLPERYPN